MLVNYKIEKTLINAKILQELFLSFIFYFFYVMKLLETCNNINNRFSISNFINNINLLAYDLFTKQNCYTLMRAYKKYLNWVRQYEIFFNSKKYKFIHLSHISCRFNMQITLQIKKTIMIFSTLIWMLNIWVNSQLWWNKHVKKMLNKIKIQINVLIHIMTFIWRVMLATAHHIYSTVIRSILMHEITVWHTDLNVNELETTCQNYKNKLIKKLIKMQNKCL